MKKKLTLLVAVAFMLSSVLALFSPEISTVSAATKPKTAAKAPVKAPVKAAQTMAKPNVAAPTNVSVTNATVTAKMLNVRQGPSAKYPVVCKLKKGQTVKVFGKLGTWYAVYDAKMGCVGAASAKYLKLAAKTTGTTNAPAAKPAAPGSTVAPPAATPAAGISQDEQTLLNLVNKARASAGAKALAFDMNVVKTARLKAKDMVDNNYFSHQSPTYGSPFDMMKQFGIVFKSAGENIAGNQTVQGAFDAWMKSEGHKKNILSSSFNYAGFGIVSSKSYGKILVQQFIGK